jgi:hypothetical protein
VGALKAHWRRQRRQRRLSNALASLQQFASKASWYFNMPVAGANLQHLPVFLSSQRCFHAANT